MGRLQPLRSNVTRNALVKSPAKLSSGPGENMATAKPYSKHQW